MSDKPIDLNQGGDPSFDLPETDEAGPAVLGRTPIVGTVRRDMGVPVLRDQLKDM